MPGFEVVVPNAEAQSLTEYDITSIPENDGVNGSILTQILRISETIPSNWSVTVKGDIVVHASWGLGPRPSTKGGLKGGFKGGLRGASRGGLRVTPLRGS